MTTEALLLAAEGEATNPLIPAIYDIVWSLIPFALVLLLFWRLVLPRLQKTLDERSSAIEGGIAEAESAQVEAKEALDKYTKLLADARAEAAEIRDGARAEGAKILAEIKEDAQGEATRIAATAKAQIEAERQQAVLSLRKEVGTLALDLASVNSTKTRDCELEDGQKTFQRRAQLALSLWRDVAELVFDSA